MASACDEKLKETLPRMTAAAMIYVYFFILFFKQSRRAVEAKLIANHP
jgi:hypothetical protein